MGGRFNENQTEETGRIIDTALLLTFAVVAGTGATAGTQRSF